MSRTARLSLWLRRRADSPGGVVGLFTWAFAEALVWPIIPDASLALLVAARPRRWFVLGITAVVGSLAGGAVGVVAAARNLSWPLLLTTPRMERAVDHWLADGAGGLAHQPLSGVPYKVFVAAAPDAGIGLFPFLAATLQYRAPRLIAVAAVVAILAAVAWRYVPERRHATVHVAVTAVASAGLLAGLAAVVARWS